MLRIGRKKIGVSKGGPSDNAGLLGFDAVLLGVMAPDVSNNRNAPIFNIEEGL
jgi:hypothetical protein